MTKLIDEIIYTGSESSQESNFVLEFKVSPNAYLSERGIDCTISDPKFSCTKPAMKIF